MVYLYDAYDQISDYCHQQLLRKMRRKISWTDRGKTVYPPPLSGNGGIMRIVRGFSTTDNDDNWKPKLAMGPMSNSRKA
jgi:hypothetical protein